MNMFSQQTDAKRRHLCSNNKGWFDLQVASSIAEGWTVERRWEKEGFFFANLICEEEQA